MLKIEEHKHPQHDQKTTSFLNAKKLFLPLCQHIGKPSQVCVEKNQIVEKNQLIAQRNGLYSAALHAPVKAKVLDVKNYFHPTLKKSKCLILQAEPDKKEEKVSPNPQDLTSLNKETLLQKLNDKGIVGMGGAGFPSHVKLNPPKKIDTLIINGCECEPYLAADYRLMVENLWEIFKGIEIIAHLTKPKKIIFAVEENKEEAIKKINLFICTKKFASLPLELQVLKSRYPQGGEKQLIYATTKRKVSGEKLPFDLGCVVFNVATSFAFYQALYLGLPLTRRLVTFCGDALTEAKNIWVNIGTTLSELVDEKIIEFASEPKKIIFGGPMMGEALTSLEYPILKTTGGVLFLKDLPSEARAEETACIGCAKCVDTCPMDLLPLEYVRLLKKEKKEDLKEFYIKDCIECGCCSYVCPARIPILDYIKLGKKTLK